MQTTTSRSPVLSKAKLFRGFAEPSRLRILEALRDEPRTVTEICRATGLSQPNASNHLACLLGCGLVAKEARGRFAYYRLTSDRVEALLMLGDEISADTASSGACCPICGSETWAPGDR
jgi:DNA-binding transcriptional ArsR family regulator